MDGITKSMMDCLELTEWGMTHYGSICTNRQLRLSVMRKCINAGLCKSVGMVELCDGDGFRIDPTREREGYVLTDKGCAALSDFYANLDK